MAGDWRASTRNFTAVGAARAQFGSLFEDIVERRAPDRNLWRGASSYQPQPTERTRFGCVLFPVAAALAIRRPHQRPSAHPPARFP